MKYLPLLAISLLLANCVPVSYTDTASQKTILYDNAQYEDNIGMVQLYPLSTDQQASLDYPVIALNSAGLSLVFDLLEQNTSYLNARYVHCNADWTPSRLTDLQFLSTYNEFPINQYNYSSNTRIPYVNYQADLPAPDKSGNYLLVVYRENDRKNVLFTRRFLVFDQRAQIDVEFTPSATVSQRNTNHQLSFGIRYQQIENPNPLREFKVVLLQNHNWHTPITGLQPTLMRPDQNYLEYRHFNGENNFPALNEFRYFDLRSIDYRGMNVVNVRKETDQIQAFLGLDKSRHGLAYSQLINDLNGGFFLENKDPNDGPLQSEYAQVYFELQSEKLEGEVYIAGGFNNWNLTPENMMSYDESTGSYRGWLWLKQGYYDYFYWLKSDKMPFYELEGSHYQTSNDYEILFYYRDPFNNYDELIGYRRVSSGN